MGWTGMFNWSSHEKNWEILNREFFTGETKFEPLKWSDKGGHVWCLFKNKETGQVYADVTLCKRYTKDHEFCYKSMGIDCGPYVYDMPKTWLPLLSKEYQDSEFARDWFKQREEWENSKKENKYEIGNVLKCHNGRGAIHWGNGFKVEENSDFYVIVEPRQTRSRTTKLFMIAGQTQTGGFYSRPYRISSNTLKNLDSVEVVRSGK